MPQSSVFGTLVNTCARSRSVPPNDHKIILQIGLEMRLSELRKQYSQTTFHFTEICVSAYEVDVFVLFPYSRAALFSLLFCVFIGP